MRGELSEFLNESTYNAVIRIILLEIKLLKEINSRELYIKVFKI